jgi:hypothetical protein
MNERYVERLALMDQHSGDRMLTWKLFFNQFDVGYCSQPPYR